MSAAAAAQVPVQAPGDLLTYEPFFGLNEKPFSLEAEPKFIYDSPVYLEARKNVLAAIRRREGLLVLTGEIGMGKTTLCRTVLRDLGRDTYSSLVPDPFAAREDLLKMLLIDFGVLSIDEVASGRLQQATRTELGYRLAQFLNALPRDAFAVAIIDEAQNLSVPLIEETRILFDTFGAKGRLQIVFSGQPELHAKLKLPEMRQVDQRVCGYQRLAPMTAEAVAGYIQHRLHAAGARGDRVLFPPAVIETLHRRTGGVPRLINRLCDRALQLAFERTADRVDAAILDAALSDIGATTLSPTWDAIVFAEPPAASPPAAAAVPEALRAPAAAASESVVSPSTTPTNDDFRKEINDWFLSEVGAAEDPQILEGHEELALPRQRVPKPAARTSRRPIETDWPRHVTSEPYIQKLMRTWAKRAAIVVAAFIALNLVIASGSFLLETQANPVVAQAEAAAPPVTVPPQAAAIETPPATIETPAAIPAARTPAPLETAANRATASAQGGYFIAVGLFASRGRADELVESLTHAGLPAMQRPYQYRDREVQQIVLGPFFSDAEARADLRRLKALGGYDDARVVVP